MLIFVQSEITVHICHCYTFKYCQYCLIHEIIQMKFFTLKMANFFLVEILCGQLKETLAVSY